MAQAIDILNQNIFLNRLKEMRGHGGSILTHGINDDLISDFLNEDIDLQTAINNGYSAFNELKISHPKFLKANEQEQINLAQKNIVNFYAKDMVNPYLAISAAGPWIVTLKGAIIYDCGGYGMLGLGHTPDIALDAMNQPHVMANIMTPSISQMKFIQTLKKEIGQGRKITNNFSEFCCLNSGSESVSIAARLADVNAKELTSKGALHEGKTIGRLTLSGSFHGRTDRPAQFSHSTQKSYKNHLKSFENISLFTVAPNNIEELNQVFIKAKKENIFIEAFFMEPVMGEGNPGQAITPEFYKRARELTQKNGTLLLIDSIQAGLRAHGVLSIIDYPGFEGLDCPDMETYSKALNAGQYPLSVLAMTGKAAELYRSGLYGNTMTTNPRALDVAIAVLENLSPNIRKNISERGKELVTKLSALDEELNGDITNVQGTGLLASCELNNHFKCSGSNSTEEYLRKHGLGVIHGGVNSLRYTPHFKMTTKEVDLVVSLTKDALLNGPKKIL
ncbi:MAG: lysine 6-aminotransferase [Woeseiaceae bacterium]|nr:lysine 6-aminotransferase [Woeseiaceae bacterium]